MRCLTVMNLMFVLACLADSMAFRRQALDRMATRLEIELLALPLVVQWEWLLAWVILMALPKRWLVPEMRAL